MAPDEFTFADFSKQPFHMAQNARLIDMAQVGSGQRIVDLACGTGTVTKLILERLRDARDSVIIAIDHSATALKQAMEELKDAHEAAVQFVQSRVEQAAESLRESADTVFFCNAIHYVVDKDSLVSQISRILKPGGTFAFNTSFFEGCHPAGSEQFYRKWMFKALRILRRDYGLSPIKAEKTEARKQLSPEQYHELVESNGFRITRHEIQSVDVPLEGWLDISSFEDWISGIMPGVPLTKASASLKKGVTDTFQELGLTSVPRNWLDVVAVRV